MINNAIDLGKELLCKIDEINERIKRLQRSGVYQISDVSLLTIGNSQSVIYQARGKELSLVEVINDTYENPDLLRVYVSISPVGIPINVGESRKFMIKEGVSISARFETLSAGNVILIEYAV